jgi:hypothetical protein
MSPNQPPVRYLPKYPPGRCLPNIRRADVSQISARQMSPNHPPVRFLPKYPPGRCPPTNRRSDISQNIHRAHVSQISAGQMSPNHPPGRCLPKYPPGRCLPNMRAPYAHRRLRLTDSPKFKIHDIETRPTTASSSRRKPMFSLRLFNCGFVDEMPMAKVSLRTLRFSPAYCHSTDCPSSPTANTPRHFLHVRQAQDLCPSCTLRCEQSYQTARGASATTG